MALLADDATDRAEQLLILTRRLRELVDAEAARLTSGVPPAAESEDMRRLVNAYRLETARIRDDRSLIAGAPLALRQTLQTETATLQGRLDDYLLSLAAAREITEGLVRACAEEVQRARQAPAGYGAQGGYGAVPASPVALDQRA